MWLLIPILIYSLVYLYIRHVYSHWKRRGFPAERASLSWRFLKQVYKREFHYVDAVLEAYHQKGRTDTPFLGIYFFFRPTLLVRDMKLARCILENSNGHFNDTKWNYMLGYRKINLLEKLAPIFAASRIESMFRNVERICDYMLRHLRQITHDGEAAVTVDMQQILRTYTVNIIGNLIYGLDSNNFEQTDSLFSQYVGNFWKNRTFNSYTLKHLPKRSSTTYRLRDIIRESVEKREDGGVIRKDVLQLLVKFRNGYTIGKNTNQSWYIDNALDREKVLSIRKLSKITESFLNVGLETIASATVLTLYEVLQEPLILNKLLDEINELNMQSNGKKAELTYADLCKLEYLDLCIQETVRKYPGVPVIERVCCKSFNIPDSRYTVSEGKTIMIPLLAMQRDELYFEDPLRYNPDRFLDHEKMDKNITTTISYGLGGGTSIAQHFSKLVIKLALVKLLQNFKLELPECEKPSVLLEHNPSFFMNSREGFKIKLKRREIKEMQDS